MNVSDEIRRIERELKYLKLQLGGVRQDESANTSYAVSPMIITGGELSDGTNAGTLKVGALTALLRSSDSSLASLVYFTLAEQDNLTMAAADVRYHVVLTSTPSISIQVANANGTTEIGIGSCMKEADNTVHFAEAGMRLQNGIAKLHRRAAALRYIELASGCTITETGGALTLGIAAGIAYGGINRFTPFSAGAFDSNVADTFTRIYRDGGGGYTKQAAQTVIDSDNYDDNSGGVAAVTVNQYSVHFIYLHPDDEHVYCVYGRDSFKLAEAITEQPYGDMPMYIDDFGVLLGKIITKKGTAIFDYVQMVTDTFFTGTAATSHANLSDLPWLSCKHTGTASRYIGFDGGGAAQERTFAQVLADLSAQAAAAFDWNAQNLTNIGTLSANRITDISTIVTNIAAGTTGQRPAGAIGDIRYNSTIGKYEFYDGAWENVLLSGDIGIADNKLLEVDQAGGLAVNDFTKATAAGLVGRSYAEALADLSAQAGAGFDWNGQALSSVGTIGCGAITTSGLFSNTGGAKLEIQDGIDGTSARGIFMWTTADTKWGIYMSRSGAGKSLNDGVACTSFAGDIYHHIRFRVQDYAGVGFIWENASEACLMDLEADTGNLSILGDLDVRGGNIVSNSGAISFGNENLTTTGNIKGQFIDSDAINPKTRFYESGTQRGEVRYAGGTNELLYYTGNAAGVMTARLRIKGEQDACEVGINVTPIAGTLLAMGLGTENLEIIDAGSAAATEQDWIEVEVGGNLGYIRVYASK